jgi:DNA-3-methyladenine glycosylase I
MTEPVRCRWARGALLQPYHDQEWGVPQRDDRALFELIVLEAAQAGLSWEVVLRKRAGYRTAFADFDPVKVAAFDEDRIATLVLDPGIVRHRGKITAAIGNAAAFLAVQHEFGNFADWLWGFVEGTPVVGLRGPDNPTPARTDLSDRVSTALRKRGFRFFGTTTTYALLQASGVVIDHEADCFRATIAPAGAT